MKNIPRVRGTYWGIWAKGYLAVAENTLRYLRNCPDIGRDSLEDGQKIYLLKNGGSIVAAIWNIKHAIEIILKTLGIKVDSHYWLGHNLQDLLKELTGKIKGLCHPEDLSTLTTLVEKYYLCKFPHFPSVEDKENTLFKYPEIENNALYYPAIQQIQANDLDWFLQDITDLERIYEVLEHQPRFFKLAKKYQIPVTKIKKSFGKS